MTEHRISLPEYAKTFLSSATRVHTERVIVMFHRWLLERCMEPSAVKRAGQSVDQQKRASALVKRLKRIREEVGDLRGAKNRLQIPKTPAENPWAD